MGRCPWTYCAAVTGRGIGLASASKTPEPARPNRSAGIGRNGGGGRDSRLAVTDRGGAGRREFGGAIEGCDCEHLPLAADLDLVARVFGKIEAGARYGLVGDD